MQKTRKNKFEIRLPAKEKFLFFYLKAFDRNGNVYSAGSEKKPYKIDIESFLKQVVDVPGIF